MSRSMDSPTKKKIVENVVGAVLRENESETDRGKLLSKW